MLLATAAPAADATAPASLQADDTAASAPSLLDDSWLNPSARVRPGADTAADAPDWLRRDELEASVAPPAQPDSGAAAQSADELPDWLRGIADESRQRLEARTQEPTVPDEQPAAPPTLSSSDDIPDWLREVTAEANAPTDTPAAEGNAAVPAAGSAVAGADDTPAWLREQQAAAPEPAQVDVVDGEVVAVELERPDTADAGATIIPAVAESDESWQLDAGTSLAAAGAADEAHARVYDVPADGIWSAQPDRPAPDGTTGQQTAVWEAPDQTATAIVPQPEPFQLPAWLEDDDIEPPPTSAAGAWSPPSWLEDAGAAEPAVRQRSASWTPPSWLDDDDTLPVAKSASRGGPWLDNRGGYAVAGGTAVMAAQPAMRPAQGQSAELLQRLLAEPAPEMAVAGGPGRGSSTMLIAIIIVLLVMAALVVVFAASASGFYLF